MENLLELIRQGKKRPSVEEPGGSLDAFEVDTPPAKSLLAESPANFLKFGAGNTYKRSITNHQWKKADRFRVKITCFSFEVLPFFTCPCGDPSVGLSCYPFRKNKALNLANWKAC